MPIDFNGFRAVEVAVTSVAETKATVANKAREINIMGRQNLRRGASASEREKLGGVLSRR